MNLIDESKILAHRGFWLTPEEKNSSESFIKAFQHGFGIETDIRDYQGQLVIAHDPATSDSMLFNEFLDLYIDHSINRSYLALNIKSDGLQGLVESSLKSKDITNYSVFDMSVPDTLGYAKKGMNFLVRYSDLENQIILGDSTNGFWVDELVNEWVNEDELIQLTNYKKDIIVVSPELHKRDHLNSWEMYKSFLTKTKYQNFFICTDYPTKFLEFLNE